MGNIVQIGDEAHLFARLSEIDIEPPVSVAAAQFELAHLARHHPPLGA